MRVVVDVPSEYAENINRALSRRRGRFLSSEIHGNTDSIVAAVPLAQMLRFHHELRVVTDGRGAYRMNLEGFAPAPGDGWRGDCDAFVGAPLRPLPGSLISGIALPEPQADDIDNPDDDRGVWLR